MANRRDFLRNVAGVAAIGALARPLVGTGEAAGQDNGHDPILIGRFERNGTPIFGWFREDGVMPLSEASDPYAFPQVTALGSHSREASEMIPIDQLSWLSPVYGSHRAFSIALNFAPHAEETGLTPPESPLLFYKPPSSFVPPNGQLDPDPGYTNEFDYEGEIAFVIGKECRNVSEDEAIDYIRGLTVMMDGSARDRLRIRAGEQSFLDWLSSKGFDKGSSLGPVIATGPKIMEAIRSRSIHLTTRLNGEVVQEGSLGDLIFSIEEMIAYLSGVMALYPGDVIATGTPSGVGQARGRFLRSGDRISIDVTHLPTLTNTVA